MEQTIQTEVAKALKSTQQHPKPANAGGAKPNTKPADKAPRKRPRKAGSEGAASSSTPKGNAPNKPGAPRPSSVEKLSQSKTHCGYTDRDYIPNEVLSKLYQEFASKFPGICRAYNIKGCARTEAECRHTHQVPPGFQEWSDNLGATFYYA